MLSALPAAGGTLFPVHLHDCLAPVRDYLPELIDLILSGKINPGFDLEIPPKEAAGGYKAVDERCAIKVLLGPVGTEASVAAHAVPLVSSTWGP